MTNPNKGIACGYQIDRNLDLLGDITTITLHRLGSNERGYMTQQEAEGFHAEFARVLFKNHPKRRPDVEAAIHDGEMGGLLVEIEQLKRTIEDRERGLRQRNEQLKTFGDAVLEWRRWAEHATDCTLYKDDEDLRARLYTMVMRSKQQIKDDRDAKIEELTRKLEDAQRLNGFEAATRFVQQCAFANSNGNDPVYWTTDMIAEALERGTYKDAVFAPPAEEAVKTGPDTPGFAPVPTDDDKPF